MKDECTAMNSHKPKRRAIMRNSRKGVSATDDGGADLRIVKG